MSETKVRRRVEPKPAAEVKTPRKRSTSNAETGKKRARTPEPNKASAATNAKREEAPMPNNQFRTNISIYLCLVAASIIGIYYLFGVVFPKGLQAEPGCEQIWEALGLARSTSSKSMATRVEMVWDCGERVRGYGALSIYACLWIALKALAIPGSMVLCVALGGLVQPLEAQVFATVCEVIGGSLCYLFSGIIGEPLLQRFSPELLARFRTETGKRRAKGDLFYFALFARQTPLIPNWFVNAASPLAGIPYLIFVSTMILGIQIATFLSIRTGALLFALGRNSSTGDSLLSGQAVQNFGILLLAQFVALIPVYMSRRSDISEHVSKTTKSAAKNTKNGQKTM